jgi:membrane protein implicated in regulation of membrane protease activity
VAGGICLLLAFFAFQVLPVSYAGILLILFGVALLILEVKVTSFGLLGIGGVISLFLGSLMLIDSPLPELQVGLRLIVPVTFAISFVLLFLVTLAVKTQRAAPVTGVSAMLGEIGHAIDPIVPGGAGHVRTHGEIWTATADEPIAAGSDSGRRTAAARRSSVEAEFFRLKAEPTPESRVASRGPRVARSEPRAAPPESRARVASHEPPAASRVANRESRVASRE